MSVERPELDDDKTMMNMHKEMRKREGRERRIRDQDEREPDLDNNRDLNAQRFSDKKKSVKKAEGYGLASDFAAYEDKDALKSKLSYVSSSLDSYRYFSLPVSFHVFNMLWSFICFYVIKLCNY